ncbi:MAG TPA: hypothetical protein DEU93_00910 [Chitinophagaceae bacterium]|nr:hypothetical protein [Chitinophagaceae bacterium]
MSVKQTQAALKAKQQLSAPEGVTPDVTGLGLRDALDILENKGFRVSVSGKGRVATQSFAAGKPYRSGQQILLILN